MNYYLIKTDAKPIDIMDCEHVIGNKRYSGMAICLSKKEIEKLLEEHKEGAKLLSA